ncbi:MAG: transposase [Actinobacteria bacterium]|nr:transposase [Actinomycetota bacterium]
MDEHILEEQELDELLSVLCTRDLSETPFPLVHLGTSYAKKRDLRRVEYVTTVMATGVDELGVLEPIGIGVGDSEDPYFWTKFLLSLRIRGLHGVRYVASAPHGGLEDAIDAVFPDARWHRADVLEQLAEDADALLDLHIEGERHAQ